MTTKPTITQIAARFGREYFDECVRNYPQGFSDFLYTDDMPDGDYRELKNQYPSASDDDLNRAWHAYADAFNEARAVTGIAKATGGQS